MNHLAHTRPTKTFIFRHLHEKCSRQNVQFFTVHFHIFFGWFYPFLIFFLRLVENMTGTYGQTIVIVLWV